MSSMITFTHCSKWNHLIYITLFLSLQIHSSKTAALLCLFQKITLTILQKGICTRLWSATRCDRLRGSQPLRSSVRVWLAGLVWVYFSVYSFTKVSLILVSSSIYCFKRSWSSRRFCQKLLVLLFLPLSLPDGWPPVLFRLWVCRHHVQASGRLKGCVLLPVWIDVNVGWGRTTWELVWVADANAG